MMYGGVKIKSWRNYLNPLIEKTLHNDKWKIAFDLLIISLVGLLAITWFKGDFLLKFDDGYFSLNPSDSLYRAQYTWDHILSFGAAYPNTALLPLWLFVSSLQNIGLSLIAVEKILYFFVFTASGISMYFLTYSLLKGDKKRIAALFAALFYMMNIFTMSTIWGGRQLLMHFAYLLFPTLVALFILGIKSENWKYRFIISIVAALLTIAFSMAVNLLFILLIMSLTIYAAFHIFFSKSKLRTLIDIAKFSILFFGLIVLVNLWFILSYLHLSQSHLERAFIYEPIIDSLKGASAHSNVVNTMRFMGWPFLYYDWILDPNYIWRDVYLTLPFIILTFIPVFLAFASLLYKNKNMEVLFFATIFVISIFLMKALNPPFENLNLFITTKVPLFSVFKCPYDKVGLIGCMGYAFLIGFFIMQSYTKLEDFSKRTFIKFYLSYKYKSFSNLIKFSPIIFLILIFLVLNVISVYPFWNGDVIHPKGKILPSQTVSIPNYYSDASNWMNYQVGEFKILKLPPTTSGNAYSWEHGYAASDPLDWYFFTGHPILGQAGYGNIYLDRAERQLIDFMSSGFKNKNLGDLLGFFNIKYILIHFDWMKEVFPQTPPQEFYNELLSNDKKIEFAKQSDKLVFYRTKNTLPLIYGTNNIVNVYSEDYMNSIHQLLLSDQFSINKTPAFNFYYDKNYYVYDTINNTAVNVEKNENVQIYVQKNNTFDVYGIFEMIGNNQTIQFSIGDLKVDKLLEENANPITDFIGSVNLIEGNNSLNLKEIKTSDKLIFKWTNETKIENLIGNEFSVYYDDYGKIWKTVDNKLFSEYTPESYLVLNQNLGRFSIEVPITIVSQDKENLAYPGVIFYVKDTSNMHGMFLRRAPDGKSTGILLYQKVNNAWEFIGGYDLKETELNQTFTIKLIALDGKVKIFLNNTQIIPENGWLSVSAEKDIKGGIGFRNRYSNVIFENFTISEIQELVDNYHVAFINNYPKDGEVNVSFQKINPTKYYAEVKTDKPFYLIFSETYENGWKCKIDGNKIDDKNHFIANGFTNGWYVEKTGEFKVLLEYEPQRYYYIGLVISSITLVASLIILLRRNIIFKS